MQTLVVNAYLAFVPDILHFHLRAWGLARCEALLSQVCIADLPAFRRCVARAIAPSASVHRFFEAVIGIVPSPSLTSECSNYVLRFVPKCDLALYLGPRLCFL